MRVESHPTFPIWPAAHDDCGTLRLTGSKDSTFRVADNLISELQKTGIVVGGSLTEMLEGGHKGVMGRHYAVERVGGGNGRGGGQPETSGGGKADLSGHGRSCGRMQAARGCASVLAIMPKGFEDSLEDRPMATEYRMIIPAHRPRKSSRLSATRAIERMTRR